MTTLTETWPTRHLLGEGVLWQDGPRARWWWTDILGHTLQCAAPGAAEPDVHRFDEGVCSFALTMDDDELLLAFESGLARYDTVRRTLTRIVDIDTQEGQLRLNDGRCDRAGHFVFGSMNRRDGRALGAWRRCSADGRVEALGLPPVAIANSTCFAPDGRTMYFADSPARRIMACDYDAANGRVEHLRVFADLSDEEGEPDGSCIDAEGCLWNARWGGAKVVRFRPDGRVDRVVEAPVDQPSCVAIGGPGFDTLCVTSARVDLSDTKLAARPQAGAVFSAPLGQRLGLPESRWGVSAD